MIQREFRTSKMADGSHFVFFFLKVAYSSEMARNATESDFRTSKMTAGSHFAKKLHKIKILVLIWNGKKCETKRFLDIQNGYRRPFFKKHLQKKLREWFEQCSNRLLATTTWYKFTFGQYIYIYTYIQLCWERGDIHCVRPLGRMHTILVYIVFL